MRIHKEGFSTIFLLFLIIGILISALWVFTYSLIIKIVFSILFASGYLFTIRFFRSPNRLIESDPSGVLAPVDGLVVAVEPDQEEEYLKESCIRVSIFMSGFDVHINWIPVSGAVSYFKYYPGKHLFARHEKSSRYNEHTCIGMDCKNGKKILLKQVAGIMARRVVSYARMGEELQQGEEFGFIKLGSRIDLYLPIGTQIKVRPGQRVVGRQSLIASWNT